MSRFEFVTREPVEKGWSGDRKYCARDAQGRPYLLRIYDAEKRGGVLACFRAMERVYALGVPMCAPLEFGECAEGVYTVLEWIEGADAETAVAAMPGEKQYACGVEAGRILKKIHSIPAPADAEDWAARFGRKMDTKIKKYGECPIKYPGGEAFIAYIDENRRLLEGRPQSYQHGDYHIGNMMIDAEGRLRIIDFERCDHGDPWEEFNRIVWCAQAAPLFASGMVSGYFGGGIPEEFWRLLALYISSNTLSSVYWAIPFGQKEVDTMLRQGARVLEWYDGMRRIVPAWYTEM